MRKEMTNKNIIPVFFAVDDTYAPLLAVAVKSLLTNASTDYFYNIHVLTTALNDVNRNNISILQTENSSITFDDISENVKSLSVKFHLRDYYSEAIYYRIFIASLFPQYDKCFYFDCDMVFVGDVSEMFKTDMSGMLLGGVQENVMLQPVFKAYSETVLSVPNYKYINSGMLLINLALFRELNIEQRFVVLNQSRRFIVAPDQDYLNVLCKDRIHYFGYEWNRAPVKGLSDVEPKIVHYKILWRPWKYDNVLFGEYFWLYAKETAYYKALKKAKTTYSIKNKIRDTMMMARLGRTAAKETADFLAGVGDFIADEDSLVAKKNLPV